MPAFTDVLFQFLLTVKLVYVFGVLAFGLYAWFTFATVYHFIRFGIGVAPKNYAFVFLIGSLLLFMVALTLYYRVEWDTIFLLSQNYVNFYPQ